MNIDSHRSDDPNHRRIAALLDTASRLDRLLHNRVDIPEDLYKELGASLRRTQPCAAKSVNQSFALELDRLGCSIWNAASKIDHSLIDENANARNAFLQLFSARLLGVALLRVDQPASLYEQRVRLLKVTLRAAQSLLQIQDTELALQALESCASLLGQFDGATVESDVHNKLTLSYMLLRIQHAKTIHNVDLAEHFVAMLQFDKLALHPPLSERAAELFHDYGKEITVKDADRGRQWLYRGLATLDACHDLTSIQLRTADLRTSLATSLVQALLAEHDPESHQTALTLAADLGRRLYDNGLGQASLLKLDAILAAQPVRRDQLGQFMLGIASVDMTDANFRIMRKVVDKLKLHDVDCAEQMLSRLVTKILNAPINKEARRRLEICLVSFTQALTMRFSPDGETSKATALQQLFDQVFDILHESIDTTATHAIQALIWRSINNMAPEVASPWAMLLRHDILGRCGSGNRARIDRKAMRLQRDCADYTTARRIFFEMSTQAREEPLSQYLAYTTALRIDDQVWASDCLKALVTSQTQDATLLYACAIEAQQSRSRSMVIETLQAIVDKTGIAQMQPVLLRCLGRLRLTENEASNSLSDEMVDGFTNVLQTFVRWLDTCVVETAMQECEWWSKRAFNLGLQCFDMSSGCHLEKLLNGCIHIIDHTNAMLESSKQQEAQSTIIMTCRFAIASKAALCARDTTRNYEERLQHCTTIRTQVKLYHEYGMSPSHETDIWEQRSCRMRRYDLEAIIQLRKWDELHTAIEACLESTKDDQWDKLADLALIIHRELSLDGTAACSDRLPDVLELLQRCLNALWTKEKNIRSMAKCLRVTLSIDQDINQMGQVTFKILDQAAGLAARGAQGLTERYPDDELQWLASTAFNHGIDRYIAQDSHVAWQLFDAALELARYVDDGGCLFECLTTKRAQAAKKTGREAAR